MRKYTQKEIKNFVALGLAENITNCSFEEANELRRRGLEQVGYSCGTYGINGALFQDDGGQLYAITARNSRLAQLA